MTRGDTRAGWSGWIEKLGQEQYERLRQLEPKFRKDVAFIACQSGCQLAALDHSLKPYDSYIEKLWRREQMGRSLEVDDVIRFTAITSPERFCPVTEGILKGLTDCGYQLCKVKNRFAEPTTFGYKAVHVIAQDGSHGRFEVQIHTPESFMAKVLAHPMYEEARKVGFTDQGYVDEMHRLFYNVSTPAGLDRIQDYRVVA